MATKTTSQDYRNALLCAIDVSSKKWVMCLRNVEGRKRQKTIDAFDLAGLRAEFERARIKLGLAQDCPVFVLHEAGRDGFSVHRALEALGAQSIIADPGSLEGPRRRSKQAKTDKLDAKRLVDKLYLHLTGEKVFSVVRALSVEDEELRQLNRERESLIRKRTRQSNEISSLLALHGLCIQGAARNRLGKQLDTVCNSQGESLPPRLRKRLERCYEQLALLNEQIAAVESERQAVLVETEASPQPARKAQQLVRLKGIGGQSAFGLTVEFFWRDFSRSKEVSGATGLCGTPFDTGDREREQGISKAGNAFVRTCLVELAWRWLRFQPDSPLTRWFQRKWGDGPKRTRRVGIIALARRLAVALWRYVEHGVIPEGAVFNQ